MANELTITRGCRTVYTFTVTENSAAVNLTGATIYFEARTDYPASSVVTNAGAVIAKTTAGDITITDAAGGVFEILFTKADTNTLTPCLYYYGIEYVPQGETDPRLIQQGQLVINPDVVRAA